MKGRLPVVTVRALLGGFDALGLDMSAVFRTGALAPSAIEDLTASVPGSVSGTLWTAAFDQIPDGTLPTQVGFVTPPYRLDMMDHVANTADTVGHIFDMLNRYSGLLSGNVSFHTERGAEDWIWIRIDAPQSHRMIAEQWALAVLYARLRRIPHFSAQEIHLTRSDRGDADDFARRWDLPVKLGRRRTGMRLSSGVWDIPNPAANRYLRATLTRFADDIAVRTIDRFSTYERVMEAIGGRRYSITDVAAEMGMSERSLQRRLATDGISFSHIRDSYRRERACALLCDGERDTRAIAYAIGYDSQSSFIRAFRRWTGRTPTEWIGSRRSSP